jgi:hypothetical protein
MTAKIRRNQSADGLGIDCPAYGKIIIHSIRDCIQQNFVDRNSNFVWINKF